MVERVTFYNFELATNDRIKRAHVVHNLDTFDEILLRLTNTDIDIKCLRIQIGDHVWLNIHKCVAKCTKFVGDIQEPLLQRPDVIPSVIPEIENLFKCVQIYILDLTVNGDVVNLVPYPFIQNEGHGKSRAVRQQPPLHTRHFNIGIAPREVELTQQSDIIIEPCLVIFVGSRENRPPVGDAAANSPPQSTVGISFIAVESDRFDLDQWPFLHNESKVNTVVIELDNLRLDNGRISTCRLINIKQLLACFYRQPAGVDTSRLNIDDIKEFFVIKGVITLDIHPVDDGVFNDINAEYLAINVDLNIREQLSFVEPFQRNTQRTARDPVSNADRKVGQNSADSDAPVAGNRDFIDPNLFVGRLRNRRRWCSNYQSQKQNKN